MIAAAARVDRRALLIVLLGGDAGLRSGEMRALEWTDINFGKRQLCVERNEWHGHVTSTKGGRLRYVPLTRRLAETLQAHRHLASTRVLCDGAGQVMAEHHLVDVLAKVARLANMKAQGPHILRHTFCSHLAMRGAPTRAIQELAGHRDLTTTQRYMHLSPDAIGDAIRLLERGSGRPRVETLWRRRRPTPQVVDSKEVVGEPGRNRTFNLQIKSLLLCQLSYGPTSVGAACKAAWLFSCGHSGEWLASRSSRDSHRERRLARPAGFVLARTS